MNRAWRVAIILAIVSSRRSESFCSPWSSHLNHIESSKNAVVMGGHSDGCGCGNSTSVNANALVELPNPSVPVHTSRRKFIQYTAATATGLTSVSASPAVAINGADTVSDAKNSLLACPLAPFSTTRTYRNIVLSNGLKVVLVKDSMAQLSSVALSIDGAGQLAEPEEIPGLAHLMEHICLSSTRGRGKSKLLDRKARKFWNNGSTNRMTEEESVSSNSMGGEEDFEDWLTENDGDSNAFTAPGFVCFHFDCPHEILPEGLERFSDLFTLDEVEATITQKPFVIPREIGRVADELDCTSDASRAFYFLKNNINPEHPFARFSAGSKTTLQTVPAEKGIDVASQLLRFFHDHYLSSKATLVVVGRDELSALDRWISPFSNVMSQKVSPNRSLDRPSFPDPMIGKRDASNKMTQAIILRSKDDVTQTENYQTLCMEWPLSLVYGTPNFSTRQNPIISAPALGWILTQIISRRGPGSLHFFLTKFGWAPKGVTKGIPRITFPVDVSGFQVLRMEMSLTLDGFSNRSAVVSAVFESIRKVIEKPLPLDLIKQYLAAGLLHGYLFAPRPPDAITLAVDSLRFGIGSTTGIGSIGNNDFNWYLMPSPEDKESALRIRQLVTDTLHTMSDETVPLVSFRASPKAIFAFSGGIVDQSISTPPVFLPWKVEPVTRARYFVESRASGALSYFRSLSWFAATFDGEELSPPYLNPLIPTRFAPRPVIERQAAWGGSRFFYLEDASAYDEMVRSRRGGSLKLTNVGTWRELQTMRHSKGSNWELWHLPPARKDFIIGLPLPVRPPEPSVECAFVVQLLSSLPSTFASSQIALANLWLLSFDDELDLAELGATAGIAYETSMNTAGLRICFRGASQTLPSYVRRFCRQLVQHHVKLLDGSTKISESVYQRAISDANRSPKISRLQKEQVIDTARQVSEIDVAKQALFFLRCTSGGYLISQGDVLPNESLKLFTDLQYVFRDFGSADGFSVQPDLRDLLYRPFWKPRYASPCLLPGISLISDSCGRIPR
eukprot:CAMPEP_0172321364 /NCGR_PEP_ID=MMETSP1058-20130122/43172_1 /TAXON_ID=83371 /ORGANISM="Detonula confervacea, Strain CCMP 353" /LENGTH=1014 /DNA_ID=CAMNT_0013036857 /DNA_START=352 /DNA_END=3396 /DNA_ORIENTATION=-